GSESEVRAAIAKRSGTANQRRMAGPRWKGGAKCSTYLDDTPLAGGPQPEGGASYRSAVTSNRSSRPSRRGVDCRLITDQSVGPLLDLVTVPLRDHDDQVGRPVRDALAAQPRLGRQRRGLIEHVLLVLGRLRARGEPLGDVHVAGGARADAAARVVDL